MWNRNRMDWFLIGYLVIMAAGIGYLIYESIRAPPLTYTLVDYWGSNYTCKALIATNRDVEPSHQLAFISDDGILIFTYNVSIEGAGYLYIANQPCPTWLANATIHTVDP